MEHIIEFKRGDESLGNISFPVFMFEQTKKEFKEENIETFTDLVKFCLPMFANIIEETFEVKIEKGDVVVINNDDMIPIDDALLEKIQKGPDDNFKQIEFSDDEMEFIDQTCIDAKNILNKGTEEEVEEFFSKLPIEIRGIVFSKVELKKPKDISDEDYNQMLIETEEYKKHLMELPFNDKSKN